MDDGKTTVYGLSSTVCFAGVVARALCRACRDIESLPPSLHFGGASRRGRMGESARQALC